MSPNISTNTKKESSDNCIAGALIPSKIKI